MKCYRLLFFLSSSVRAGIEEHVLSLLQELSRENFVLGLACPPLLARDLAADLADLPVAVFPVEATAWTEGRETYRLWGILRDFRPDIVHAHLFRATMVVAPLARAARVPVVLETYHGREAWRRGQDKRHFFIDRLVARCVDRIIAVSEAAGRFLVERKGIPASKIIIIPNGRDLTVFQPGSAQRRRDVRRQLGVSDETRVLGVVGRLEEQKGHRFLLEAFSRIHCDFPETRLLLVGEGSLRPRLKAQAERLGLQQAVIFAGFQRDIPAYIEATDIMVLPSLHEGMPLMAIEAAAMARPVVASAVDGTPEVVRHGKTGLLVPPAEPTALAEAVLSLLRQPGQANQFGAAARRWALARFDIRRQVAETERVYMELTTYKRNHHR